MLNTSEDVNKNSEVSSELACSVRELASLCLPGYPTTERAWLDLVKREQWPFVEFKSKGRGGIRREYQPPAEMVALIQTRKLAYTFSSYRETYAIQASMEEAEKLFVSDYNAGSPSVTHVEGITQITVEMLRDAWRRQPLSAPEQPEFSQQERATEDIEARVLKGHVWLNANVLMQCHEAVDDVLAARGERYSPEWCMAAAIEAYNHVLTSIGTSNANAYELLGHDEFKAAATLGILALSTKKDDELFIIPLTAIHLKPWPGSGHTLPADIPRP